MKLKYTISIKRKGKRKYNWFLNCEDEKALRKGINIVLKHYSDVVDAFKIDLKPSQDPEAQSS